MPDQIEWFEPFLKHMKPSRKLLFLCDAVNTNIYAIFNYFFLRVLICKIVLAKSKKRRRGEKHKQFYYHIINIYYNQGLYSVILY